ISNSEQEKDVNNELEEEKVDLSCGIWKFRTNAFGTCFANLYVFATFVGLSALFSEMIRSIIHVQLTSIEKQFNIDNSKAGLLDVVTRAGYLSTILFGGHFAKKAHIPIVIGLSGIFQAFLLSTPAFLQFALPYELPVLTPSVHSNITNTTSFGDNAKYMCDFNATNSTTKQRTENLEPTHQVAFVVLLVMQTIKGVSDTFHASFLPVLYMDDNILDKGKMGIFLGIQHVITDLASPIGKEINGLMTEIPIDLKKTQLDPKDGRFVAAWWLAFLVFGVGLGIASFPLLLFPRKLISKSKQKEALDKAVVSYVGGQVLDEIVEKEADDKVEEIELEVSDRKESIKSEVVNMPPRKYSINVVSSRKSSVASVYQSSSRRPSMFPPLVPPTERKVSIAGDLVFEQPIKVHAPVKTKTEEFKEMLIDFPKAIFRLLRNPAYDLLLLDIVIMSVPFSGLSLFRSVYTANEYNVPMSTVTLTSGISTALGHIVGTSISSYLTSKVNTRMGYVYIIMSSYILTCAITPLYIIFGCDNQMVHGAKGEFGIPVNTSSLCDCTNSKVLISCGDDGHNYLNPCVAGCQDVDGKTFTDCRLLTNSSLGTNVNPGLCASDCYTNFIIYTFLSGLQSVVIPMAMIPRRLLVLRIVDPRDRGFATSMFMFFFSFMAIPSPNLFGKVIDGTCLVWDGRFCALYDRDKIRYFLSGLDVGVYGLVLITFFVMFVFFKWEERKLKRLQQRHSVEESSPT
ncbi:solute carrier organic anion transporter family member 2A1, partial [Biomphalaria glabrata]